MSEQRTWVHVVHFSGGAGSFLAAKRLVEAQPRGEIILVTADTSSEANDWTDFVYKAAEYLGQPLVHLKDGRDIWDVATQQRYIPSPFQPNCTRTLKARMIKRWFDSNLVGDHVFVTHYFGFDCTEIDRADRRRDKVQAERGERCDFPLLWQPLATKEDAEMAIKVAGLTNPLAYRLGLPHNNCLKYGCFMGGQKYWAELYDKLPETFERAAARELQFQEETGKDNTILTITRDGETRRIRLTDYADMLDDGFVPRGYGTCGCYDLGEE